MAWTIFIAVLMISSLPTYSWSSIRIRQSWRMLALAGLAMFGAALLVAPWPTLLVLAGLYLLMIPAAFLSYQRVKQRRAAARSRA
jgi:CDP-diacylglycerol--serine O-phosphatidyltransferase